MNNLFTNSSRIVIDDTCCNNRKDSVYGAVIMT